MCSMRQGRSSVLNACFWSPELSSSRRNRLFSCFLVSNLCGCDCREASRIVFTVSQARLASEVEGGRSPLFPYLITFVRFVTTMSPNYTERAQMCDKFAVELVKDRIYMHVTFDIRLQTFSKNRVPLIQRFFSCLQVKESQHV